MNTDTHGAEGEKWTGFDLDGTLAKYDGWKGIADIGDPVPAMCNLAKRLHAEGRAIKIVTARVAPGMNGDPMRARAYIAEWCRRNLGFIPPITHAKDQLMETLYDDRVHAVEQNTGRVLNESGWRTTRSGHRIHIDESGRVDKGNPHVISRLDRMQSQVADAKPDPYKVNEWDDDKTRRMKERLAKMRDRNKSMREDLAKRKSGLAERKQSLERDRAAIMKANVDAWKRRQKVNSRNSIVAKALVAKNAGAPVRTWGGIKFYKTTNPRFSPGDKVRTRGGQILTVEKTETAVEPDGYEHKVVFFKEGVISGADEADLSLVTNSAVARNATYHATLKYILDSVKPYMDKRLKGDTSWRYPMLVITVLRKVCDSATMSAGRYDGKHHRIYDVDCTRDGYRFTGNLICTGLLYTKDPDDVSSFDEYDMTLSLMYAGKANGAVGNSAAKAMNASLSDPWWVGEAEKAVYGLMRGGFPRKSIEELYEKIGRYTIYGGVKELHDLAEKINDLKYDVEKSGDEGYKARQKAIQIAYAIQRVKGNTAARNSAAVAANGKYHIGDQVRDKQGKLWFIDDELASDGKYQLEGQRSGDVDRKAESELTLVVKRGGRYAWNAVRSANPVVNAALTARNAWTPDEKRELGGAKFGGDVRSRISRDAAEFVIPMHGSYFVKRNGDGDITVYFNPNDPYKKGWMQKASTIAEVKKHIGAWN